VLRTSARLERTRRERRRVQVRGGGGAGRSKSSDNRRQVHRCASWQRRPTGWATWRRPKTARPRATASPVGDSLPPGFEEGGTAMSSGARRSQRTFTPLGGPRTKIFRYSKPPSAEEKHAPAGGTGARASVSSPRTASQGDVLRIGRRRRRGWMRGSSPRGSARCGGPSITRRFRCPFRPLITSGPASASTGFVKVVPAARTEGPLREVAARLRRTSGPRAGASWCRDVQLPSSGSTELRIGELSEGGSFPRGGYLGSDWTIIAVVGGSWAERWETRCTKPPHGYETLLHPVECGRSSPYGRRASRRRLPPGAS